MSINLLFTQMPLVQQITHVEQAHPELQQMIAREVAAEELREQRDQIQKTEPQDDLSAVHKDASHGGSASPEGHRGRKHHAAQSDDTQEQEHPLEAGKAPWAGNIINVEI